MNIKKWTLAGVLLCLVPAVSQARDTTHYLPFDEVVNEALQAGRLDGSVKFYLASTPKGAQIVNSQITTNQKTNAFNKSDEEACRWVLQSALIKLQDAAKAAGANAVVDITSYYKKNERRDAKTYECHAGAIIAGVALKAKLAKVR
ncbi:excinuclease [Pseudomonas matsuisoli]|uniref:Phosphoribosylglycinamide formyltransferase n=1 Tax=Pseudomonas matsuisoli TaxID=1515666 RepID=A0A917PYI5_9PSED|nr:excinuclease [Pseudomonas matsuisoli]GGJ99188.1 phosphoribosylglycinamide formyltransferase [Pseudomonas matsuisoli]